MGSTPPCGTARAQWGYGTPFYGVLLATKDGDEGHRINIGGGANGIWLADLLEDALQYSVPTVMVADKVHYRVV